MSTDAQQQPSSTADGTFGPSGVNRFRLWRYRARRARLGWTAGLVITALIVGAALGRWTAPADDPEARRMLEEMVLPLALDADGIWTSSSGGAPPVSEALVALQRDADPAAVLAASPEWLVAYDETLASVADVELPSEARPVQRQFIAAITLSRDAVEVLRRAATIEDLDRRQGLLTEVGRLRMRGEQLTQSARASILDVSGHGGEITPLPELPDFPPAEQGTTD